ncbi:MAG TPA: hypothetical protein VKZ43_06200 [Trueperaceae bacterium]|nr:hypothetical protein [Trueperaceae bacterium]
MNLVPILVAAKAARFRVFHPSPDEQLRRAGYADGERKPRMKRHWANR